MSTNVTNDENRVLKDIFRARLNESRREGDLIKLQVIYVFHSNQYVVNLSQTLYILKNRNGTLLSCCITHMLKPVTGTTGITKNKIYRYINSKLNSKTE